MKARQQAMLGAAQLSVEIALYRKKEDTMRRQMAPVKTQLSFFDLADGSIITHNGHNGSTPSVTTRAVPARVSARLTTTDLGLHPWMPDEKDRPYSSYGIYTRNLTALQTYAAVLGTNRINPSDKRSLAKYLGFGGDPNTFKPDSPYHNRIRTLVNADEFQSMQEATPFAFYTPTYLVRNIWRLLEQMGFFGGNILEPAAGIGHFVGAMPDTTFLESTITAVELEKTAATIAGLLYEEDSVTILNQPFEGTRFKPNSFDLIISNVPFGDVPVHDPAVMNLANGKATRTIHDYYFVKAMQLARPGGLIAFLTSRYTLDKKDASVRNHLADHADLVAAYRFPNDTFYNTEAVADLIILRKRLPDDEPTSREWTEAEDRTVGKNVYTINRWMINNPSNVLGEFEETTGPYGMQLTVFPPRRKMPMDYNGDIVYRQAAQATEEVVSNPAPPNTKPGEYYLQNGTLYRNNYYSAQPIKKSAKDQQRIQAMIELATQARKVLEASASDDPVWEPAREALSVMYDSFVQEFGRINTRANIRPFKGDPRASFVRALEMPNGKTWERSHIFIRKTVGAVAHPEHVDSAVDAYVLSLNHHGKIDFDYMQQLTGNDLDTIMQELAGTIYYDPAAKEWVPGEEYLSGNVVQKLADAQDAGLAANVAALETVQPDPILPDEIYAALGANWIPAEIIQQFVNELVREYSLVNNLEIPDYSSTYHESKYDIRVKYLAPTGTWLVDEKYRHMRSITDKWSTARRDVLELVRDALNQTETTIYDTRYGGTRTLNQDETTAARAMKSMIRATFTRWVWRDQERANKLASIYNKKFNLFVMPTYDGSHLTFPGLNSGFAPRGYQKNTAWRVLRTGTAFLWHIVGSGKTAEIVLSVMESRRLGRRKKPMVVVPNHLLDQFASEWYRLYPLADLLIIQTDDLKPAELQTSLARIATGDYDAILLTQASFVRIPVGETLWSSFMTAEIERINDYLAQLGFNKYNNSQAIKILERKRRSMITKMQNRVEKTRQRAEQGGLTWESLGVDMLVVDEAQTYKNLEFTTNLQVAGINGNGSAIAYDMFVKAQWTSRRCKAGHLLGEAETCHCGADTVDGSIVLATGTALDNSVAEMYTWQRLLQMGELAKAGLTHFDAWAAQFGDTETVIEMKPSGKGWRQKTRFVRFHNIPELIRMFGQVCDTQLDPNTLELKRPDMIDGAPIPVECEPTEAMEAYIDQCAARVDKLSTERVDPSVDNMLKIMGDAMRAATDMRLIHPDAVDDPRNKVNRLVNKLYEIWESSHDLGVIRTQAVFLDVGTPGSNSFDLYADIKQKLVTRGIPAHEIAFAQTPKNDAEKKTLFSKVDRGEVKIIIGSTRKMGTGVNMQSHLYALHHLDAPWTPGSIEQRDGRILRNGNQHKQVAIYRYVTVRSMDFYRWHLITLKANFIRQIATGGLTKRSIQDLDNLVLSFAQMKALATGDQTIIEQVRIESELTQVHSLYMQWKRSQASIKQTLEHLPERLAFLKKQIETYSDAIALTENKDLSMIVNGKKIAEERENKTFKTLYEQAGKLFARRVTFQIGPAICEIHAAENDDFGLDALIKIGGITIRCKLSSKAHVSLERIRASIADLANDLARYKNMLRDDENRLRQARNEAGQPFAQLEDMKNLQRRLAEIDAKLYGNDIQEFDDVTQIGEE